MICSIVVFEPFCSPDGGIVSVRTIGAAVLARFADENVVTGQTGVVANLLILAAVVGCLYRGLRSARREARGHAMSIQRLCSMPTLAVTASTLGFIAPVDRPHNLVLWIMGMACGFALGVAHGCFVNVQVDREWRLMRIRPARDGLMAMRLLVMFGAVDLLVITTQGQNSFWHPLLTVCTAACASFMVGRFAIVWQRARAECHIELGGGGRGETEVLLLAHGAATWSSRTARLTPGYVPVIPPAWRKAESAEANAAEGVVIVPSVPKRKPRLVRRDARGRFISASAHGNTVASPRAADTSVSSEGYA